MTLLPRSPHARRKDVSLQRLIAKTGKTTRKVPAGVARTVRRVLSVLVARRTVRRSPAWKPWPLTFSGLTEVTWSAGLVAGGLAATSTDPAEKARQTPANTAAQRMTRWYRRTPADRAQGGSLDVSAGLLASGLRVLHLVLGGMLAQKLLESAGELLKAFLRGAEADFNAHPQAVLERLG